jgi:nuclear cap-binding protein subunit 1
VFFESSFSNSLSHDFPNISLPEHNEKTIYPVPRVVFRLFDYTDVPEEFILPGAHSIERYLVEEQLHTVIDTYFMDRKLCANKLLQVKITNKIPLTYMIVEVIFSQLFALPKPIHLELFYGSLLLELCKLQPNQIPLVLAQATELLFDRLDHMKASCVERFSSWFAYHLSNFQFKWSWEDWKDCVSDEDKQSPKNCFLRETLVRSMRLSYHQRVAELMPATMNSLVPQNPKPTYKYVSDEAADLEGTSVANKLLELFKERAIPEDVFQALRDIPDKYNEVDNEYESFNPLKIEVFTSTLLYYGHKSFSHTFASLAKYHMIFKMIVDNENSQLVVLSALHQVWKHHQQVRTQIKRLMD